MKITVSGGNGFVGRAVCRRLHDAKIDVAALVRRTVDCPSFVEIYQIPDDNFATFAAGCTPSLRCDVFVHLAARVHVMNDGNKDMLDAYRAANVQGTLAAAEGARRAGARRIVFLSSAKALGAVDPGRAWLETDEARPVDPYGQSKLEAERALQAFGREHGIEVVILRPPLVYGPGVRANFAALLTAVVRRIPLPLGSVGAKRSMVYVENLADAIHFVSVNPGPTGGIFHVTDGDDMSVAELVQSIAEASGRRARLMRVPVRFLRLIGRMTGKMEVVERLTSPLRLDSSRLTEVLGWQPPYTVRDGLAATVRYMEASR